MMNGNFLEFDMTHSRLLIIDTIACTYGAGAYCYAITKMPTHFHRLIHGVMK